jgi:hypothetical protein
MTPQPKTTHADTSKCDFCKRKFGDEVQFTKGVATFRYSPNGAIMRLLYSCQRCSEHTDKLKMVVGILGDLGCPGPSFSLSPFLVSAGERTIEEVTESVKSSFVSFVESINGIAEAMAEEVEESA